MAAGGTMKSKKAGEITSDSWQAAAAHRQAINSAALAYISGRPSLSATHAAQQQSKMAHGGIGGVAAAWRNRRRSAAAKSISSVA